MELTLIRHAKSSWANDELSDFDRPLDRRGLRDAPVMAKLMADRGQAVDVILASTAVRAMTTAGYFAEALGCEIVPLDQLYSADPRTVAEIVVRRRESNIAIVAHDPTLSILARYFDSNISHMPTCAVAWFSWNLEGWKDAIRNKPDRCVYDIPRDQ